jgi:hypothetical protein
MSRPFGYQQLYSLKSIPRDEEGEAMSSLLALRGRARKYWSRYADAVSNAMDRHNFAVQSGTHDTDCAPNCPLRADDLIESFEHRGYRRYRLRKRETAQATA